MVLLLTIFAYLLLYKHSYSFIKEANQPCFPVVINKNRNTGVVRSESKIYMESFLNDHNNGHLKDNLCSCCGWQADKFDSMNGRKDAKCPKCGAVERHRRACAILGAGLPRGGGEWLSSLSKDSTFRLVHFGPHSSMGKTLDQPGVDQVSLDMFAKGYRDGYYSQGVMYGDVTDISLPSGFADGVIIFHVLEHVPDIEKAMQELRRILSPKGWLWVEVPCRNHTNTILHGEHKDCRGNMSEVERLNCSGQFDHQWVYDCDSFRTKTLLQAGFYCYEIDGSDPADMGSSQPLAQ